MNRLDEKLQDVLDRLELETEVSIRYIDDVRVVMESLKMGTKLQ